MSFPSYPKYTESRADDLGAIPCHWGAAPMKHLTEIDNSGCYGVDPEDADIVLPVATTAQIDTDGRFMVGDMPQRGFTQEEVDRYLCRDGDILVVKSSGSATNIISGKAGLVDANTPPFVFSNFLMRIRPRTEIVSSRFIYSVLRSHLTRQRVEQMCSTTTYPNLQVPEYSSALLPVPLRDEQDSISSFLDVETSKIDGLVSEQRRLIELLKEKRQAAISHGVTKGLNPDTPMKSSGVQRLGNVPAHWGVVRLRRVGEIDQGCAFAHAIQGQEAGEVPWFKVKDMNRAGNEIDMHIADNYVSNDLAREIRATVFPVGTVIFPRVGAALLTNKRRVLSCPAIVDDNVYGFIPENIHSRFLYLILLLVDMAGLCSPGLVPTVTFSVIKDIYIPLPPATEQEQIVEQVERATQSLDQLVMVAERAIELLQERRAALISAAVTGKIDVREYDLRKTA